jgi:hypothetical protein
MKNPSAAGRLAPLVALAALALPSFQACATQRAAGGPPSPAAPAAPSPAEPAEPAAYRFGTVHFPVDCAPAAQEAFDVAVGALHSFFYPETVKLFSRVAALDPSCAMAHWGIAISQMPNPLVPPYPPANVARAQEAIARGLAIARTPRDRAWLGALDALFHDADTIPLPARARRYESAMARLWADFPDDAEAAAFHALALLMSADPHDLSYDRQYRAARILQDLLPGHPDHPGVTHYLIHAYDYSPIAGQGLAAANQYAHIAPSAPHALHMPSHIYSMLGMWKEAIASDLATLEVARAYAERNFNGKAHSSEFHSLDFLENAYLQLGRDDEAAALVRRAAEAPEPNVAILAAETGRAAVPVRYALERRAWAEAAANPRRPSPFPFAEAIGAFGRAVGAARLGDAGHAAQAREEIDRLSAIRERYLAAGDRYWSEQTQVLADGASAWLAHASKDDIEAVRLMRQAAELEDASEKHVAMENRLCPMRQQLGDLLLELRRPDEALAAYQGSLRSTPNRFLALAGAARAAEISGLPDLAREYGEMLRLLAGGTPRARAELQRLEADRALAAGWVP